MKKKIIIGCLLVITLLFFKLRPFYYLLTKTLKISVAKTLLSKDSLKTFDDQVNILILGIPGGKHQGPNLSDTIIVANYNLLKNRLTTISIPRDIWSDTLRDKINTAYAYGEVKMTGGGLKLAKAEISTIIGQPIHYSMVIDFSKFEELIDYLGGINIDIERSFTDNKFPIPGKEDDDCGDAKNTDFPCRYETISFKKGETAMDGKTALKFVRSRNAQGAEGSDFAREKRQQKVIDAVEEKILKILKSADLDKIKALYLKFNDLIDRDISNQQLAIIGKNILLKKYFGPNLTKKTIVLTQDFFFVPPYYQYDGKYVLIPNDNDFNSIHQYLNCHFVNGSDCEDILEKEGEKNQ